MPHKDKEKHKAYQREYQKRWRKKNKESWKQIRKKHELSKKRIEYRKKWWKESPKAKEIRKRFNASEKGKQYRIEWSKNNMDKVKLKQDKYYKTDKGKLNVIKKVQKRRIKFKEIAGVYYNFPSVELIKIVKKRDKVCVYCGDKFSEDKNSNKYPHYDHVDAFKPHSIKNTVKACCSCNCSKGDKDVWVWLNSKSLTPSKIIYELTS